MDDLSLAMRGPVLVITSSENKFLSFFLYFLLLGGEDSILLLIMWERDDPRYLFGGTCPTC